MNLISEAAMAARHSHAARYAQAQPFRHVVIPNFLDDGLCKALLADFPDYEARFALNEMGEVGGKAGAPHAVAHRHA